MFRFERIEGLLNRLATYSPVEVAIELILLWLVVYVVVRFVRGTRATPALKGLLVIIIGATVVAWLLRQTDSFQRLGWLYDRFLTFAALGLLVIFQPELRRALVRLGETPFFRQSAGELAGVVDSIVSACTYLSKSKFGAIIVLQRQVGLRGLVEAGTPLNAKVSAELLQTIFFPGTALHDLAVVINGDTIQAAGVQLPLADPDEMPETRLGSRHRAAVGVTKEYDALVIVVSEETGQIRLAERGRLSAPMKIEEVRAELLRRLRQRPTAAPAEPPSDTAAAEGFAEGPRPDAGAEADGLERAGARREAEIPKESAA